MLDKIILSYHKIIYRIIYQNNRKLEKAIIFIITFSIILSKGIFIIIHILYL